MKRRREKRKGTNAQGTQKGQGGTAHLTALAGNEGGHKGREKRKKGKGRLSASPAYAGEVGGIGDDSGVLLSRSRAVIWKDRHDPFGNMAFACLCGAPSLIVISKCSKTKRAKC